MASTTSSVSSSINVGQIVSGLMDVARAPVRKIETQIEKKDVVVSALGTLKSKVSTLEVASRKIQDAWLFAARNVSSTNASAVSATATSAAREGAYSVKVAQTAQSETISLPGLSSATQVMDLSAFKLVLDGVVYQPEYSKLASGFSYGVNDEITITLNGGEAQSFTVTTQTTAQQVADAINQAVDDGDLEGVFASVSGTQVLLSSSNPLRGLTASLFDSSASSTLSGVPSQEGLSSSFTATDFQDMVNLLDAGVQASLVQTESGKYAVSIVSKASGAGNLSFATPSGTLKNDTYTLSYDGSSWSVSSVAGAAGSFDGATFSTASGSVNLSFQDPPKSGESYVFSVSGVNQLAANMISVSGVNTATTVKQVDSISLSGTFAQNDTVTVTVGGVPFSYVVQSTDIVGSGSNGDTYTNIATGVTALIDGPSAHVSASASGSVISLTSLVAGNAFTATATASSASAVATRAAVTANLSAVDLTGVSFGAVTGTVTNDTYTAEYDGTNWAITSVGGAAATLVGNTFQTGAGNTVPLIFTGTPKSGDQLLFSVTGTNVFSAVSVSEHNATRLQSGRDAYVSINGLSIQRSSNQISDVISGVTLSLNSPVEPIAGVISSLDDADFSTLSPITLTVSTPADDSSQAFRGFVTAFNDLVDYYREQTVSSSDPEKRGILVGDPSLRSFMERLRSLYFNGLRLADGSNLTFGSIGIALQVSGKLEIDEREFAQAVSDGLQSKLNNGVVIGYESASSNFTQYLTDSLRKTGIVSTRISDIEAEQVRYKQKITELETKLSLLETRYYKQYASLDALLVRLQSVNNALTSALSGLSGNRN
jgi:flagellar hook-associated protein 2